MKSHSDTIESARVEIIAAIAQVRAVAHAKQPGSVAGRIDGLLTNVRGNTVIQKANLRALGLGGRRPVFNDNQIATGGWLIEQGQPAFHIARDLVMSRANLDAQLWIAASPIS